MENLTTQVHDTDSQYYFNIFQVTKYITLFVFKLKGINLFLCATECEEGMFGPGCLSDCHCTPCDRVTGLCFGPCDPGWIRQWTGHGWMSQQGKLIPHLHKGCKKQSNQCYWKYVTKANAAVSTASAIKWSI